MFTKSSIHTKLDEKILAALAKLDHLQSDTKEYTDALDRIAKLHKLKSEEAQIEIRTNEIEFKTQEVELRTREIQHKIETDSKLKLPNTDTMLLVGANIFGILWMTRYEREHVISSKALGFVMRPRS